MATGGGDANNQCRSTRPSRGNPRQTVHTFTAPKHVSDEELARKIQAEEENQLFENDRMTAHHLQEQYSGMRLYNDLATATRADNEEKTEEKTDASKSDEEYARELADKQLAYKLQVRLVVKVFIYSF